jgi:hypothetical protein
MSILKVTIVDYGMGNIFSVVSAFKYLGAEVEIVSDPEEILKSSILVKVNPDRTSAFIKMKQIVDCLSCGMAPFN